MIPHTGFEGTVTLHSPQTTRILTGQTQHGNILKAVIHKARHTHSTLPNENYGKLRKNSQTSKEEGINILKCRIRYQKDRKKPE